VEGAWCAYTPGHLVTRRETLDVVAFRKAPGPDRLRPSRARRRSRRARHRAHGAQPAGSLSVFASPPRRVWARGDLRAERPRSVEPTRGHPRETRSRNSQPAHPGASPAGAVRAACGADVRVTPWPAGRRQARAGHAARSPLGVSGQDAGVAAERFVGVGWRRAAASPSAMGAGSGYRRVHRLFISQE
jgi:hypothetical protein